MSWKQDATVAEARERVSAFLQETGSYKFCSQCPINPEVGCCDNCEHLQSDDSGTVTGCGNQNLSCLSFACTKLGKHLLDQDRLSDFVLLTWDLPREGRRGCQRREDTELLQISSVTQVSGHVRIPSDLRKEAESS